MSDAPDNKPDYRSTVFLPRTDFPMKAGLPQKEPLILAKWQEGNLYQQVRAARDGREKFILHDGPPYANGDIHIGHALNHILKDMVVRTQTLLGKDAPYVPGWDCHGLPIEWKVEEQYRKKKRNKDEVPVKEFRAECRAYAQHWVDTQREQLKRLGIDGQWDKPYLTMNFEAEGTIVAELYKFAESGQLYRGAKPVMWSPVEKTALAEAEIEYEDITSTQIDVAFDVVQAPNSPAIVKVQEWCSTVQAVVWTTTPWTIPVNQGLAYNPDIEYSIVNVIWQPSTIGGCYIVASELVEAFLARLRAHPTAMQADDTGLEASVVSTFPGTEFQGAIAQHPMARMLASSPLVGEDRGGARDASASQEILSAADAAGPLPKPSPQGGGRTDFFARPRPFLPGDFVTTDSGTGLVHMSPDHGEDDFELCKANGIDPVFAVEGDGKYREDWLWLGGQGSVINPKFNAPDGPICSDLKQAGALLAASFDYQHSYPHSWRSKAKVIYRCTPQWFIAMDRPLGVHHPKTRAEQRWENEGGAVPVPPPSAGEGQPARSDGRERGSDLPAPSPVAAIAAPPSPAEGGGATLRSLALAAIAETRFVPEKGRNRIGSMVEGRPDWVLSRQRAWGVPIAVFVERKTGKLLVDHEVNERIVAAIKAEGVDAWDDERAQEYLGNSYNAADYERVTDILDVWFDSGCTHVFTLESGHWPEQRWPADLYLEGSDQHRGWFQSSLLESCGTRGRAPYDAVLTHGFTMDAKGLKMSKSIGNTIDPLKVMETNGADIIRLWALSVDYTEDHRIGDEILKGVGDQYRKLRNSFRYLLGALDGFSDDERVGVDQMPELERYMLALTAHLDARLRQAVVDFDFNTYVRALNDFCNDDLSAFYFDIRKDCLYCEVNASTGVQTEKRRAYRAVLDTLFHALVRWAAPVLVFTAEEVWGTRYPDAGSVHLLEWPEIDTEWRHNELEAKWAALREQRIAVTEAIEPLRRDKVIGSSLEAEVTLPSDVDPLLLAELFIVSTVRSGDALGVTKTSNHKCGRCWRHLPEVAADGDLCARCDGVVNG